MLSMCVMRVVQSTADGQGGGHSTRKPRVAGTAATYKTAEPRRAAALLFRP